MTNELMEKVRDVLVIRTEKNRKVYAGLAILGMLGTVITVSFGFTGIGILCLLMTSVFFSYNLYLQGKEDLLRSMVDDDMIEKYIQDDKKSP